MNSEHKNNPIISVVIPMYNCEEFVPDLLNMFSNQSFKDFEVICVIDGAIDGTEYAVERFCKTDARFRYVLRDNGGAGAARNTGIDEAKGKYIIFPDADDVYSKDYLLKLFNSAEKQLADISVCGSITFDHLVGEQRNLRSFDKKRLLEREVYSTRRIKRLLQLIDVHISNKLFLFEFIKNNNLRFSETKASNDLFFSKMSIACAERIVVVHDDLITIRRHFNTNSISSNRGKYSHIALNELQKIYDSLRERDLIKNHMSDYLWMFDITANYEMKNGINPMFVEEFVKILNSNEPWKKLKSSQIRQIFVRSLGDEGNESSDSSEKAVTAEDAERIKIRDKIFNERNRSKFKMQEMIKKESLEKYNRDLDDLESVSPIYLSEIEHLSIQATNRSHKNELCDIPNNPDITVIIPMYNCADYVNGVLSMFESQSFSKFELICVIDGATDNTEELVKSFCSKDRRFRYVIRENGGPGPARNIGLEKAKGKYIVFSDADDEYSEDYLKKLHDTAVIHDAQIVVCRFNKVDHILHTNTVLGFSDKKFYENIPYSHWGIDDLFVSFESRVTNKLFNTKFLRDNGLQFPKTRAAEDFYFCYTAFSLADRILVTNDILLNYRLNINPESLRSNRGRYQHEVVDILRGFYLWLKDYSLLETHGKDYYRRVDKTLVFESSYEVTPRFISEFAHMINAEEPWDSMTPEEVLVYLKYGLLAVDQYRTKKDLIDRVSPELIRSDEELSNLFNYYKNRVHTAELLQKVSKERYGKVFFEPSSVSILAPRKCKNIT